MDGYAVDAKDAFDKDVVLKDSGEKVYVSFRM